MTIKDIKKDIKSIICISDQEKYYQEVIKLYLRFIEYLAITNTEKLIRDIEKMKKMAIELYDDTWKEL
jgi:flagellin-specific chaperone FliS